MGTRDYLEWDIYEWSKVLKFWSKSYNKLIPENSIGLELGARNGGVTAFFAKELKVSMIHCSDYNKPSQKAFDLHKKLGLSSKIEYLAIDATSMDCEDGKYDFVVFKSVLGSIGREGGIDTIKLAIKEIKRVLKPGGVLFFAENLSSSRLHMYLRNNFVPWGNKWYYLSIHEIEEILNEFETTSINTRGFFSSWVPDKYQVIKLIVHYIDNLLFFISKNLHYISYGYAKKRL